MSLGLTTAVAFALALATAGRVLAQEPTPAPAAAAAPAAAPAPAAAAPKPAAPPDKRPLARYIPGENLLLIFENDGLENHSAAWGKTAAFKMLNDTPLGEMIEAIGTQLTDKALASATDRKLSGSDVVAILKHLAKQGFVYAAGGAHGEGDKAIKGYSVLVIRGAAGRDVIGPFSRLLGTMMNASKDAPTKPALAKKGTRSIVTVPPAKAGAKGWVWWTEGKDLVLGGEGADDLIGALLDGKGGKSAVDNPIRGDLTKLDQGFEPIAWIALDPSAGGAMPESAQLSQFLKKMGVNKLDYRFGFENESLMGVVRLQAPKPRQGLIALLEQPTFDRSRLLPLPEGIGGFSALTLDASKTLDVLLDALPTPDAKTKLNESLDSLKTKSRVDLKKDLLAHIGPRMVVYIRPGPPAKPAAPAAEEAAAGGAAAAPTPAAPTNPLAGLATGTPLSPSALTALSSAQVPRLTIVAEVVDPVAFGKTLDNLMVAINHQLSAKAAELADAAEEAAGGDEGQAAAGGTAKRSGRGGEAAKGKAKSKAAPSRRTSGSVVGPEFRLMQDREKEKDRIYALTVPPSMSKMLPAGFRPTIRLSDKLLAISTTPDAARQALATKPGAWSPPSEIASTFDALPKNLMFLGVSDPRTTDPEVLASLPKVVQTALNTAAITAQAQMNAAGNPGGGAGGAPPGVGNVDPRMAAMKGNRPALSVAGGPAGSSSPGSSGYSSATMGAMPGYPGASGVGGKTVASGYPGMSAGGYPGMTGGGGAAPSGGGGGASNTDSSGLIQFNIEASKLPKADDLRGKMFPSTTYVSVDDQEIKIVSRSAFPSTTTAMGALGAMMASPAFKTMRESVAKAAGIPVGKEAAPAGDTAGGAPTPGGAAVPGAAPGAPGAAMVPSGGPGGAAAGGATSRPRGPGKER